MLMRIKSCFRAIREMTGIDNCRGRLWQLKFLIGRERRRQRKKSGREEIHGEGGEKRTQPFFPSPSPQQNPKGAPHFSAGLQICSGRTRRATVPRPSPTQSFHLSQAAPCNVTPPALAHSLLPYLDPTCLFLRPLATGKLLVLTVPAGPTATHPCPPHSALLCSSNSLFLKHH